MCYPVIAIAPELHYQISILNVLSVLDCALPTGAGIPNLGEPNDAESIREWTNPDVTISAAPCSSSHSIEIVLGRMPTDWAVASDSDDVSGH